MSLSAFQSSSRCAPALAIIIGFAVVFGTSFVSGVAIAQPSPPEASEPATETAREPDAQPGQQEPGAGAEESSEAKANDSASSEKADEADRANASKPGSADTANEATKAENDSPKEPEPAKPSQAAEVSPAAPPRAAETDLKKLTVATWSGAYGEAQRDVVIDGFKTKNSVAVRVILRKGKDLIDLAPGDASTLPDAAEFSGSEIDAGCSSGQLVKLADGGESIVAPANSSDFLPGSLKPCGIGAFAWSHVVAVNPAAFKKRKPKSLADVFNSKRFPGKRAFIKGPQFLLEAALMADGAKPEDVYDLLGTQEGLRRAFSKLDQIRDDILWVDNAKAAMSAVAKGDAGLAQSFSGRAFFAAARGTPIEIIWDGQIYAMTYWAIPAKSPRRALARAFLDFATEPQQMAAVAQRFPYGPTRTSALALTKRHIVAGLDLQGYLPTAPANMKTALSIDEAWWDNNRNVMETAFSIWVAKPAKTPAKKE